MTVYNHFWNPNISYFYNRIIDLLVFKKDYDFVFISKFHPYNGPTAIDPWPKLKEELIRNERPVIIFIADDEYYTLGDEYIIPGITKKIFKHYVYFGYKDHPIIRPIPLPAVVEPKRILDWEDRIYDYSFMGVNNPHRSIFRLALEKRINDNRTKFTFFYEESQNVKQTPFYHHYANILNNTKLSFCPLGWRCNECYRTIESARFGSIILSSELLPHWYNLSSPYIKVNYWTDLSIIDTVLSKTKRELKDLSYNTRKWYEDYLSPKAVADFVTREVLN